MEWGPSLEIVRAHAPRRSKGCLLFTFAYTFLCVRSEDYCCLPEFLLLVGRWSIWDELGFADEKILRGGRKLIRWVVIHFVRYYVSSWIIHLPTG
mmetsp:Transcript_2281/g.6304  ORF Transcript_2281/g.6304 Transcript_2281/m.6304 type:complete len:95 (-) Transcript_2281:12-296(-)